MYSAKNPSCLNKPNLILPSFNYLWVGTIQTVNICFLINCVCVVVVGFRSNFNIKVYW